MTQTALRTAANHRGRHSVPRGPRRFVAPETVHVAWWRVFLGRLSEFLGAIIIAFIVSTFLSGSFDTMTVPENSTVLTARGSAVTALAVIAVVVAVGVGKHVFAWIAGVVGAAVAATVPLAVLLRGSPFYLFGLGGDQSFRVAYLTRFSGGGGRADVYYADALSFYPPLWFWTGGIYARLTGTEGWLAYKPFSLITMAVAAVMAFVLWRWLLGAPIAAVLAVGTACVGTFYNAYEPYSWLVVALVPPLIAWSVELMFRYASTGALPALWAAVPLGAVVGVFSFTYTLLAVVAALSLGAGAASVAWKLQNFSTLTWLGLAGTSAFLTSLVFWGPYLWARLSGEEREHSVAADFMPDESLSVFSPLGTLTAFGITALVGLVATGLSWGTVRGRRSSISAPGSGHANSASMACAVILCVATGWFVASLLFAFNDTSLLAFRIIPLMMLAPVLAGLLVLAQMVGRRIRRVSLTPVAVLVSFFLLMGMAQATSVENEEYAEAALEARGAPPELLEAIDAAQAEHGLVRPVVLSDTSAVFAQRDLFSFQAPMEAYATPFARYGERNAEIVALSEAHSTQELLGLLDGSKFRAPDMFILRHVEGALVAPVRENHMPSIPGSTSTNLVFDPALFDEEHFHRYPAGAYEVFVRSSASAG